MVANKQGLSVAYIWISTNHLPKWFLLVYNWLHSVGQNHFYVMMLLYREAFFFFFFFFQSLHFCFVFQKDSVQIPRQLNSVPLQLFGRRDIPSVCSIVQASSVRTMRTFCLNLPLCREASGFLSKTHALNFIPLLIFRLAGRQVHIFSAACAASFLFFFSTFVN
jgi:hypothetical protein